MKAEGGRLIRKLRDDVGLDQSGSGGGGKKGSRFKCILNYCGIIVMKGGGANEFDSRFF